MNPEQKTAAVPPITPAKSETPDPNTLLLEAITSLTQEVKTLKSAPAASAPVPETPLRDDPFALLEDLEAKAPTPPAQTGRDASVKEPDWDSMTARQIVHTVLNVVEQQIIPKAQQPLIDRVELVRLSNEIDKITEAKDSEGKPMYPDFWDFKKEIFEIGSRNPSLTVKEAYLLAKGNKAPAKKEEKAPPVPKPKDNEEPPFSSRPGATSRSLKEGGPVSVKLAAERAFDEIVGAK